MIFAVLDPSPLTVCINCSFLHLLYESMTSSTKPEAHNDFLASEEDTEAGPHVTCT